MVHKGGYGWFIKVAMDGSKRWLWMVHKGGYGWLIKIAIDGS